MRPQAARLSGLRPSWERRRPEPARVSLFLG